LGKGSGILISDLQNDAIIPREKNKAGGCNKLSIIIETFTCVLLYFSRYTKKIFSFPTFTLSCLIIHHPYHINRQIEERQLEGISGFQF
jgi:MFS superfamily sulfate permease-like transporter